MKCWDVTAWAENTWDWNAWANATIFTPSLLRTFFVHAENRKKDISAENRAITIAA